MPRCMVWVDFMVRKWSTCLLVAYIFFSTLRGESSTQNEKVKEILKLGREGKAWNNIFKQWSELIKEMEYES